VGCAPAFQEKAARQVSTSGYTGRAVCEPGNTKAYTESRPGCLKADSVVKGATWRVENAGWGGSGGVGGQRGGTGGGGCEGGRSSRTISQMKSARQPARQISHHSRRAQRAGFSSNDIRTWLNHRLTVVKCLIMAKRHASMGGWAWGARRGAPRSDPPASASSFRPISSRTSRQPHPPLRPLRTGMHRRMPIVRARTRSRTASRKRLHALSLSQQGTT